MGNHPQAVAICWTDHQVRIKQLCLFLVALFACWLLAAMGHVSGQDASYKTLPLNAEFVATPSEDEPRDRREVAARRQRFSERTRLISDIFKGDASLDDNRAEFDQWFNEVIFAQMAQDSDAMLELMGQGREQLFKQINNAANAQAYDHLVNDLALTKFQEIATDNYHPACRLNAVVILGRLDSRVGQPRRAAPQPLAAALPILLQYVQDGALPEYVRVGALWGIERHCRIDGQKEQGQVDAALRAQLISALLPMLGPKPDDRAEAVDYWMKRMAVRSLGGLRELGNNDEVASTLMGVMEQSDAPMLLRCEAASAYGGLKFGEATKAQPAKTAGVIAKLAAMTAQGELDYLDLQEKQIKEITEYKSGASGAGLGGFGPMGGGGSFGPMGGDGSFGPMGGDSGAGAGAGGSDPSNPMGGGASGGSGGMSGPGGFGGFGGFGGSGGANRSTSDLPVYRFRISQRRLMTHVLYLQQAMQTGSAVSPGLLQFSADSPELNEVDVALSKLMVGAQTGISDKETFELDESLEEYREKVQASLSSLVQLSGSEADGDDPFVDPAAADGGAADSGTDAGTGDAGN